jgi:circadian clock protein KaiC
MEAANITSIRRKHKLKPATAGIAKAPSGIDGLDDVTGGGLPAGRPTLICGSAGCGKTLFAVTFLYKGATEHDEPGVFISFEETSAELSENVASLGFDLDDLQARKLLAIDHIKVDRHEIAEAGDYDLEGLFVRLDHAMTSIGASFVAIDTLEALFSGFTNEALLRAELRRLFHWLKARGATAIITAERGDGSLTRYGLEEYVSDCVIALDNEIVDETSTRRLRIVKYRGSAHGANPYPFLIDERGFSVLPLTSLGLDYPVSTERVSTGIPALDDMLDGGGYYRGSSVLISGTAGTGKSSLAAMFADASCRRKEKALYFALEESGDQVIRNMRSIGLDLGTWRDKKLLEIHAARPSVYGLEMHLVAIHRAVERFQPRAVVLDPISSFTSIGSPNEVKSMLVRLFDYLKTRQITCVVTSLSTALALEETTVGISSLIDTWFQVRDIEIDGERTRGLWLVKSRGMGHSNQVREFLITSGGVDLIPVAVGPNGVLTGSARLNMESELRARLMSRQEEIERQQRALVRRKKALDAQIDSLQADYAAEVEEAEAAANESRGRDLRQHELHAQRSTARNSPRAGNGASRSRR